MGAHGGGTTAAGGAAQAAAGAEASEPSSAAVVARWLAEHPSHLRLVASLHEVWAGGAPPQPGALGSPPGAPVAGRPARPARRRPRARAGQWSLRSPQLGDAAGGGGDGGGGGGAGQPSAAAEAVL